jgi:outer membrane protein assembly factor BamB
MLLGDEKPSGQPIRLRREDAWKTGWPMFTGPFGNFSTPLSGTELVGDLSQTRLAWMSEESDIGDAKKLSQSVAWNNDKMPPGGVASLIVADGLVFTAYFKPRGDVFDVSIEAAVKKAGKDFHKEQYLVAADDVLLAVDASTGKTKWKAVETDKGMNFPAGKRRGWGVTPAYHQGRVFSVGTTGRLYAYDAVTGKKLWEKILGTTHEAGEREKKAALTEKRLPKLGGWLSSLVVADGVLIVPLFDGAEQGLRGVEPATGKTLWEVPRVLSRLATPAVFRHDGHSYLLANTAGGELRCLDPQTGKVLWTVTDLGPHLGTLAPSDTHVLLNVKPGKDRSPGLFGAYRISSEKAERAWTLPNNEKYGHEWHLDSGAIHKIVIRDGLVYLTPRLTNGNKLLVLQEKTGKILVEQDLAGQGWGYLPILAEDRLLVVDDLSHTATNHNYTFTMYPTDPTGFAKLGEVWHPAHRPTNGYEVPMVDPIVAGRWFMRGRDGHIHCYDLRKPAK